MCLSLGWCTWTEVSWTCPYFNPHSAAGECSQSCAERAAAALLSPSKNSRYFPGCHWLFPAWLTLLRSLDQIFPHHRNPSKIHSSPTPLHLLVPYHLPHFLSVPSPWLRQQPNPRSKQSKSCCWSCHCFTKPPFFPNCSLTLCHSCFFSPGHFKGFEWFLYLAACNNW